MAIATIMVFLLEEGAGGNQLMNALSNGLLIVGVGTIGWAVINKAKEGDIWSAVSTAVLGGLALAFVVSNDFREFLIETVRDLVKNTDWEKENTID